MAETLIRGHVQGSGGSEGPVTGDQTGATRTADAHGRYMDAVLHKNVYFLAVSGAAATAYSGGAAGTPLLAIHNPANSNKRLVLIGALIGSRVAASAAGTVAFELYGGPSVIPTGTATVPTNMLSLTQGGSVAKGFANAALTGSTALSFIAALASYYWATAASAFLTPAAWVDLGGMPVVEPGNQVALGGSAALTSATWNVTLVWEEIDLLSYGA